MQAREDTANRIYKICERHAWEEARRSGYFSGSADDQRDGYIHLSTAHQIPGTLAEHFAGQIDLVLIGIDAGRLGAALRWEPSRGGALFPHLYGVLGMGAVVSETAIILGADGRHRLPEGVWPC